jgi:hypothetical protein
MKFLQALNSGERRQVHVMAAFELQKSQFDRTKLTKPLATLQYGPPKNCHVDDFRFPSDKAQILEGTQVHSGKVRVLCANNK